MSVGQLSSATKSPRSVAVCWVGRGSRGKHQHLSVVAELVEAQSPEIMDRLPAEDVAGDPPGYDEDADGDDDGDTVEGVVESWETGSEWDGHQQGGDVREAQHKKSVGLKGLSNVEVQ